MLTSLGQVLPAAAAKYGDKTALITDNKTFSFRDLDQLSNALAISLTKLGVVPGDRVTLCATNSWEWLVSYYGVLKTGAVINPVNVMLAAAEVGYVTRDCGAKVLIGSREDVAANPALLACVRRLRHQHCVWRGRSRRCAAICGPHQPQCEFRSGTGCSRATIDDRLYVGNDRSSQGGDAVASRGDPQRRDDRAATRQDVR